MINKEDQEGEQEEVYNEGAEQRTVVTEEEDKEEEEDEEGEGEEEEGEEGEREISPICESCPKWDRPTDQLTDRPTNQPTD